MLFQACRFVRNPPKSGIKADAKWEPGIANVESFGVYTQRFVLDQFGQKVRQLHNIILLEGPACHIAVGEPLST